MVNTVLCFSISCKYKNGVFSVRKKKTYSKIIKFSEEKGSCKKGVEDVTLTVGDLNSLLRENWKV